MFEPLDLTVNIYAKSFMKRMFAEWFASKICEGVESGKTPENVDVKMNLSILKPLQTAWIIKLYNKMTSLPGENVILKGWKKASVNGGIEMETAGLLSLDPFDGVDPIVGGRKEILDFDLMYFDFDFINKDRLIEGCTTVKCEDGDGSKLEDPNDDGCAFDLFDDDG